MNLHVFISVFVPAHWPSGKSVRQCFGDLGSIPGRVIPKTLKMALDISLLNTQLIRYVSRVKWSNPGKEVAPSLTPQCSSNWKGASWSPSTTVANYIYISVYWISFLSKHSNGIKHIDKKVYIFILRSLFCLTSVDDQIVRWILD